MRRSGCVTWMDLGTGNPSQLPFSPFLCFPCFLFIETSSGRELTPQLCPPPPRPRILPLVYRPCLPLPIPSFLLFDAQSLPLSFLPPFSLSPSKAIVVRLLFPFIFMHDVVKLYWRVIIFSWHARGTPLHFFAGVIPPLEKMPGRNLFHLYFHLRYELTT